jgi:hypothetical protein
MSTHLEVAKEKLFGEKGLRASNFKLFPGKNRDASREKVAEELVKVFERLEKGEYEVVAGIDE